MSVQNQKEFKKEMKNNGNNGIKIIVMEIKIIQTIKIKINY